ncbi:MAG TPA: hypothetical protein VK163_09240 [Opitutaceae bacterium]|nr:hypothetical protein [Opitutaceae bacterium]
MHLLSRLSRLGCVLATLSAVAFAEETRSRQPASVDDQDAISLRGLFDFQLPKLIRPESVRFTLNPSFGDVLHRDQIRFRTGVRYAFTKHFEVSAEIVPFIDNFGGNGANGFGVAEYRFGTKLGWRTLLDPIVDTAFGATVAMPAPGAPEKLTIGTTRFTPYVVFSRDISSVRGLGAFLNLAYECFDSDPDPDRIPRYRPTRDNIIITPGVVLHRAPWHYTLATALRTTALDGEKREYFSVLPYVSYEVPERWLPFISGRVVVGAGYEAIFFGGEYEQRITSRLRWDFDWVRAARNLGSDVLDTMPWRNGRSERH